MTTPTNFEVLLSAAAAWGAEASAMLAKGDSKLSGLADAAITQGWPLVVAVSIDRLQVDLCLINPEGQMQSLVTAGIGAPDARRAN